MANYRYGLARENHFSFSRLKLLLITTLALLSLTLIALGEISRKPAPMPPPVGTGATDFYAWISQYDVGGAIGFEDDPDGDGLSNGLEYILGTDPSLPSRSFHNLDTTSNTVFRFQHSMNPALGDDVNYRYLWSRDLNSFHEDGSTASGTTINFEAIADGTASNTVTVLANSSGAVSQSMFYKIAANFSPANTALPTTLFMDRFITPDDGPLHERRADTVSINDSAWSATTGITIGEGKATFNGIKSVATLPVYPHVQPGDQVSVTVITHALEGDQEDSWFGLGFTPADAKIMRHELISAMASIGGKNDLQSGSAWLELRGLEQVVSGMVPGFNPTAENRLDLHLDTSSGTLTFTVNGALIAQVNELPVDELHLFERILLFSNKTDAVIDSVRVDVRRNTRGLVYHDEFLGKEGEPIHGTLPDQRTLPSGIWTSDNVEILSSGNGVGYPSASGSARATLPLVNSYREGDKISVRTVISRLGGGSENWLGIGFSDKTATKVEVSDMKAWILLRGSGNASSGTVEALVDGGDSPVSADIPGFDPNATFTVDLTYDASTGRQTVSFNGGSQIIDRVIALSDTSSITQAVLFFNKSSLTEISSFRLQVQSPENDFQSPKEYWVADFGAVGDATTDDGPAIRSALAAIREAGEPATLHFESGKTYRLTSGNQVGSFSWGMDLNRISDLEIRGNGATIIPASPVNVFRVSYSENVTIRDLTIDYFPLPFVVGRILNVNKAGLYFDLEILESYDMTPLDPPGDPSANYASVWQFGIPVESVGRHHVFINSAQPLPGSSDPRKVRVYVGPLTPIVRMDVLAQSSVNHFWLPHRDIGHGQGFAAHIGESSNVTFENLTIYSNPEFIFSVKGNFGPINFNAVNTVVKPGRELGMVSWRDVYHCQNNRGPIRITNSTGEHSHDDMIALASQNMIVQRQMATPTTFRVDTKFIQTRVGDLIHAVDVYRGIDLGDFIVTEVRNTVVSSLKDITLNGVPDLSRTNITDLRFTNHNAANAFSRIENNIFQGSARFRSRLTYANNSWNGNINIRNYAASEGGPLPRDQYYYNSNFFVTAGGVIRIDAENKGPMIPEYRVKNIYFEKCSIIGGIYILDGSDVTGLE